MTGERIWSLKVDDHAAARVTGAPTLVGGRLYVPVSSLEELPGARPDYPCCTFRGSIVAIDAATGKPDLEDLHDSRGADDGRQERRRARRCGSRRAPRSGPRRRSTSRARPLYVATGNAYTEPAAPTSDAVMALALDTGAIQWVSQVTPSDAFVVGCRPDNDNCPDDVGPDFDFGNSPILRRLANGRTRHRHRPEVGRRLRPRPRQEGRRGLAVPRRPGQRARRHRVGLGRRRAGDVRAGLGRARSPRPAGCTRSARQRRADLAHAGAGARRARAGSAAPRAQSAAISVIPGVVFSGSVDGHIRAYDTGRRPHHLGLRHGARLRDRERRARLRRLDRRPRPDHRRRDAVHRLGLRAVARPARQRAAGLCSAVGLTGTGDPRVVLIARAIITAVRWRSLVILPVLIALSTAAVGAQRQSARVQGEVIDADGQPVSGAAVELADPLGAVLQRPRPPPTDASPSLTSHPADSPSGRRPPPVRPTRHRWRSRSKPRCPSMWSSGCRRA